MAIKYSEESSNPKMSQSMQSTSSGGGIMGGIASIGNALNNTHANVLDTLRLFGWYPGAGDAEKEKKRLADLQERQMKNAETQTALQRNQDEMQNKQFGLSYLAQQRAGAGNNYRGKFLNDLSTALRG